MVLDHDNLMSVEHDDLNDSSKPTADSAMCTYSEVIMMIIII